MCPVHLTSATYLLLSTEWQDNMAHMVAIGKLLGLDDYEAFLSKYQVRFIAAKASFSCGVVVAVADFRRWVPHQH